MVVEPRLSGGQNNISPNGSLGGERSDTKITDDLLENLFDNIKRNEALTGKTEFRCIYIFNTGPSHISGVVVEITINPAISIVSIGLDSAGKGDGRNNGIATNISTEDVVPTGVKFFGEDTASADGPFDTVILPIGLLKNGESVPIWLKRVTETGAAQTVTLNLVITHDAVTLPGKSVDDGGAIGELIKVTITASGTFKIGPSRIGFSDVG